MRKWLVVRYGHRIGAMTVVARCWTRRGAQHRLERDARTNMTGAFHWEVLGRASRVHLSRSAEVNAR